MLGNCSGSDVWVLIERSGGSVADVSLELLAEARRLASRLGSDVAALLPGCQVGSLAEELLRYGPDRVFVMDHPVLAQYRCEPYASAVADLCLRYSPGILLMGATTFGAELAARVAAKLRTGLSADCVRLDVNDQGHLLQVVPAFGGGVMATIVCPERRPQMATVRAGVLPRPKPCQGHGQIETVELHLSESDVRTTVVEVSSEAQTKASISQASVVVAGGWGAGDRAGWALIEALASALGGAVGATRPALDEGWATEGQMIGQSGITVRPDLYIGVGISGMMHHLVGIQEARVIVAINSDPKAPIFEACDIGVVGDFREILPHLIEELQRRRAQ